MLGFRRRTKADPTPKYRFPTLGGAQVKVWPSNRWSCTGCGHTETGFTEVGAKVDAETHAGRCRAEEEDLSGDLSPAVQLFLAQGPKHVATTVFVDWPEPLGRDMLRGGRLTKKVRAAMLRHHRALTAEAMDAAEEDEP